MTRHDELMFWLYGWSITWALMVMAFAYARYRTDRFDPLYGPIEFLLKSAVVCLIAGVGLLIGLDG